VRMIVYFAFLKCIDLIVRQRKVGLKLMFFNVSSLLIIYMRL
jgi:hypothetical protein